MNRVYVPEVSPRFSGCEEFKLIAWPPDDHIRDSQVFACYVDRIWDHITSRFDQICIDARPLLEVRIARYLGDDPTPRPKAESFLDRRLLNMIKIDATDHPGCSHELMFKIESDQIFHCDVGIKLDPEFVPFQVYFDG